MADITPVTREEKILAGEDITPVTRTEKLLKELIDSGGGGGGGESVIAWKPKVEADGTISWTRTASTTKPAEQNIKGEKGDKGDKGDTGAIGAKGDDGAKGETGEAGFSPTVTITDIPGGHRVTITDETHPTGQSFDVMDGSGGGGFSGNVPAGGTKGQALVKKSGTDGDYEWGYEVPSYTVDKPEGTSPVSGNVVQVGSFTNTDGAEYGIYEFYYKTSALPAADTTKTYSFSPLLDDYTIFDFIDQSGITSNGHVISSGRTDGTNRIIIQQFSKNNKNVMLRAYGDYTAQTALLRIKFIGTKNV